MQPRYLSAWKITYLNLLEGYIYLVCPKNDSISKLIKKWKHDSTRTVKHARHFLVYWSFVPALSLCHRRSSLSLSALWKHHNFPVDLKVRDSLSCHNHEMFEFRMLREGNKTNCRTATLGFKLKNSSSSYVGNQAKVASSMHGSFD